ncbi:MAG: hypothetical protein JWN44_2147, partial [Myxococcales bacterium]|nr:hypothetical protein [Myxococcales bacterium]
APAPTTPTPPAPTPTTPAPTPPPAREISVIVDSIPAGAKILRDGKVIGDTPEAVKLTAATALVLEKDGYLPKPITVDPSQGHKTVVKLERTKKAAKEPVKVAQNGFKPGEPVDPYANAPPSKGGTPSKTPALPTKPAPPPAPKAPADMLTSRVERQSALSLPGGHRLGAIYKGAAAEEDGRSDWYVDLELGKCYTFVGEGGDGVKALYLYLWGPHGRRVRDSRVDTPHAQMTWCTLLPGNYHFQAKVSDGKGEYRVGIYTR